MPSTKVAGIRIRIRTGCEGVAQEGVGNCVFGYLGGYAWMDNG